MTIEADDGKQELYLDLVEFCMAEIDQSKDTDDSTTILASFNSAQTNNKRKWPKNRIVDLDTLDYYKRKYQSLYNIYQESILLMQERNFNNLSSFIPLSKVFEYVALNNNGWDFNLLNKKKKALVDTKTLKSLTRHKELNWLQSTNSLYPIKTIGDGNCLCHAVLSYLIGMQDINICLRESLKTYMNGENSEKLKTRWLAHRKAADLSHSIQSEEKSLEKEWTEIISMKSANVDQQTSNTNNTQHQQLMYLEDIHIFALANYLLRPIIVISLETLRNIQPIHLRGVYLPLLNKTDQCIKDPIVIAFHNFHFMPLLYALDDDDDDDNDEYNSNENQNNYTLRFNEKYFHFENIDNLDNLINDHDLYSQVYNLNSITIEQNENFFIKNQLTCECKPNEFYNILPLVYYNGLKKMKVHFLIEQEEQTSNLSLMAKYLNLVEIEVPRSNLLDQSSNTSRADQIITVLCCHLNKNTTKQQQQQINNKNGIFTYLTFLNQTINKNLIINQQTIKNLCKKNYCTQEAMQDIKKYYGYCYSCFKKEFLEINKQKEIEPQDKMEQQYEIVYSKSPQRVLNSAKTTPVTTAAIPSLRVCQSSNCNNLIQSSELNKNNSDYCRNCIKIEEQKKARYEELKRQTLTKTAAIELPIRYESSYNIPTNKMTTSSKLYNTSKVSLSNLNSLDYDNTDMNKYQQSTTTTANIYPAGSAYNQIKSCVICKIPIYYSSNICSNCSLGLNTSFTRR